MSNLWAPGNLRGADRVPGTIIPVEGFLLPRPLTNVIAIASSDLHGLALLEGGAVIGWGGNFYGQISIPQDWTNIISIATAPSHSLVARSDGSVAVIGRDSDTSLAPPLDATNVIQVAVGFDSCVALRHDGTVVTWGGQIPNPPSNLTNVIRVAAGMDHCVALLGNGEVVSWAQVNQWDQATVPNGLSGVIEVFASNYTTHALRSDGTVVGWGKPDYLIPPGITNVLKVSISEAYGVALLSSGRLVSWRYPLALNPPKLLSFPTHATDISMGLTSSSLENQAYAIVRDPYIVAHPVDATLKEASDHDLSIDAYGTGGIHVQWAKDGIVLPGETNALLSLRDVRLNTTGDYQALVSTDWVVTTSKVARILVQQSVPYLVSNATPVTAIAGENVVLAASIKGSLPIQYQWFLNGFLVPGATNSRLALNGVTAADAGNYTLTASNKWNTAANILRTGNVRLNVRTPPSLEPRTSPLQRLSPGNSLVLSPGISGDEAIQSQWLLNGNPIRGETSRQLVLRQLSPAQNGDYALLLNNRYGTSTWFVTRLEITNSPPIFIRQPSSTAFTPGQPLVLQVEARGNTPLLYSWFHNNLHITNTTEPYLLITNTTTSDAGKYYVAISNSLGTAYSDEVSADLGDPFPNQIDLPNLIPRVIASGAVASPEVLLASPETETRLLIGSETGGIYSIRNGASSAELWLDLSPQSNARPGGFIKSMVFSPHYLNDRLIYVSYVSRATNEINVSRFKALADFSRADEVSEEHILSLPMPYPNGNHAQLSFDSNGFLNIATGDGGFASTNSLDPLRTASNPNSFLGKILRVSVKEGISSYAIPDGNPFQSSAQGLREIWCMGLQKPQVIQTPQSGQTLLMDAGWPYFYELHHFGSGLPRQGHFGWSFRANGLSLSNEVPPSPNPWIEPQAIITNRVPFGVLSGVGPNLGSSNRLSLVYTLLSLGQNELIFAKPSQSKILVKSLPQSLSPGRLIASDLTGHIFTELRGTYYEFYDSGIAHTPVSRPSGGSYVNDVEVVLDSDTPGAKLYYTLDGREPEAFDPWVTNGQTIIIRTSSNLKVRAERIPLIPSITRSRLYELKVATPLLTPATGPILDSTSISISCETLDAEIRYTIDGSLPRSTSPLYEEPITINGNTRLLTRAFKKGYVDSDLVNVLFRGIPTAKPSADPAFGPITNNTPIILLSATPDAVIRYTIDGDRPDSSSPIYTSPILVQGGQGLRAVAQSPGYAESEMLAIHYPLAILPQSSINPASGAITPGTMIQITCSNTAASIYYTLDGSTPTSGSMLYQGPIEFTSPALNLKAIALAQNWGDSPVVEATYGRWIPESTAVFTVAGNGSPGYVDGPLQSAQFRSPTGMCRDPEGNLYIADAENHVIRLIKTNGVVSTFAGNGQPGYRNGSALSSEFNYPVSVCIGPNGDVYVADNYNLRLRRITRSGSVSTLAGNGILDSHDGIGSNASFESMSHLAWGPGTNLYLTGSDRLRVISTAGRVSSLLLQGLPPESVLSQGGLAFDSQGNATIATIASVIVRRNALGTSEIFVGDQDAFADGPRNEARLNKYSGPARGLALDTSGNVYFSDLNRIRKLSPDGSVSTWAGTGEGGYINGLGSRSRFLRPAGILIHTNNSILVADSGNHCIRMIAPDADGDAIPDLFESSTSPFHLNSDDRLRDEDHDGIDNATEWGIGTDPAHADSTWRMAVDSTPNRLYVIIRWPSAQGRMYQLQYSGDLKTWLDSYEPFFGNGTVMEFTDPRPTSNLSKLYYRMRITNWDAGGTP